jgi:hypothetical protein
LIRSDGCRVGDRQFGAAGNITGERETVVGKYWSEFEVTGLCGPTVLIPGCNFSVEAVLIIFEVLRQDVCESEAVSAFITGCVDGQGVGDVVVGDILIENYLTTFIEAHEAVKVGIARSFIQEVGDFVRSIVFAAIARDANVGAICCAITKGHGVVESDAVVARAVEFIELSLECRSQRVQLTFWNRGSVGDSEFGWVWNVTRIGEAIAIYLRGKVECLCRSVPPDLIPRRDGRCEAVIIVGEVLRELVGNGEA